MYNNGIDARMSATFQVSMLNNTCTNELNTNESSRHILHQRFFNAIYQTVNVFHLQTTT